MLMIKVYDAQEQILCQRSRVGSKKSVQQGRSYFCSRSLQAASEHGEMARTPLAVFQLTRYGIPRQRNR